MKDIIHYYKKQNTKLFKKFNNTKCLNVSNIQNYNPIFQSVGNVCEPVKTFKNELNAQGLLNYPEAYHSNGLGSPLN